MNEQFFSGEDRPEGSGGWQPADVLQLIARGLEPVYAELHNHFSRLGNLMELAGDRPYVESLGDAIDATFAPLDQQHRPWMIAYLLLRIHEKRGAGPSRSLNEEILALIAERAPEVVRDMWEQINFSATSGGEAEDEEDDPR